MKAPVVNTESVTGWVRRLGLQGDPEKGSFTLDSKSITYSEGPFDITLYKASGGLKFRDRSHWQIDDGKTKFEMSDEDAVHESREYLRRTQLVPEDEYKLFKTTHFFVASSDSNGGHHEQRAIDAGVCFQRTIRNFPVEGPGGKAVVYLDAAGGVTGAERVWREPSGVHHEIKRPRPPEAALEDMRSRFEKGEGRVEVNEMRFGYFELGLQETQKFLQPAHISFLRLVSPDERFFRRSVHVMAADPEAVERLEAPPPPGHPQTPR